MKKWIWAAFFTSVFVLPAWAAETKVQPAISGDSIFNSGSTWRDPKGGGFKLSDLRGQKIVLTMAYTSCTYTCPLAVAKLKEIETALVGKGVTDFKIVLASFDPVKDDPAKLARYLKEKKLGERWVLLSPRSDKDVRELAALLGVTYSRDKQGEYTHSNIITYVDGEGVIRFALNGIGADSKPLVEAVAGAGR